MKRFPVISLVFAIGSLAIYGCKKETTGEELTPSTESTKKVFQPEEDNNGTVYVLSNQASGNEVLVYTRSSKGLLAPGGSFPTNGFGTGAGIGSQGSVILQERGRERYLFAVNAGSNDITAFRVNGSKLIWLDKVSSHGTTPISLTASEDLLYVVNAGGTGNISGFHIDNYGHLTYLQNSTRSLSSDNAGPAQIQFNNTGTQLVVTEKNTNTISTYTVFHNGLTSALRTHPSVGITPFGFGFDNRDQLIVTDAFGGAEGQSAVTSYNLGNFGNLSFIDGPKGTHQTSACWLAITNNSKYCYAANTGSGTISGYRIHNGDIVIIECEWGHCYYRHYSG